MTATTTTNDQKGSLAGRSAARLAAVQALYQMDIVGAGVDAIANEYETFRLGQEVDGEQYIEADAAFFRTVVTGVVDHQRDVDREINEVLTDDWPLKRIDSILRAVLRASVFELMSMPHVPARVVINEYLDIAGAFFENAERRMANGVMDRVARRVRDNDPSLEAG